MVFSMVCVLELLPAAIRNLITLVEWQLCDMYMCFFVAVKNKLYKINEWLVEGLEVWHMYIVNF